MKVICEGLDLSDAILKVSKALGTKKANQILEGIKLTAKGDDLILMATDTELTIEKTIQANVIMEGETVVPGKYFMDFVKKLENEQIELSVLDEGQLKIKYADAESEMQVYNAEEFPKINKEIKENFFLLSQGEFKDLIAKTSFSCSQDDSRPILKGCLFEVENGTVTSVALDGFRMAVCKKQAKAVSGDFKAIIPARTLNEITRLLEREEEELNVVLQKNNLMVEVGSTVLVSRLYEGEFINYKQILPTSFLTEFTVDKDQLLNSVERAAILSRSDRLSLVKMDVKEKFLNVTAKSEIGTVNENISIALKGKDLSIAFNAKYLSEYLKILSDEKVRVFLNSPIAPCILRPQESEDYLYLVLPVRINS